MPAVPQGLGLIKCRTALFPAGGEADYAIYIYACRALGPSRLDEVPYGSFSGGRGGRLRYAYTRLYTVQAKGKGGLKGYKGSRPLPPLPIRSKDEQFLRRALAGRPVAGFLTPAFSRRTSSPGGLPC